MTDDASLIVRCINRDKKAWSEFVERFSRLILWAIKEGLRHTNHSFNQQDIEDVFQNVFALLWEKDKLRQVKNKQKVSGWLAMVAANCAHNYLRSRKNRLAEENLLEKDWMAAHEDSPDQTNDQQRLYPRLEQTFDLLPARELIILMSFVIAVV